MKDSRFPAAWISTGGAKGNDTMSDLGLGLESSVPGHNMDITYMTN
jgi:hypothetical protein